MKKKRDFVPTFRDTKVIVKRLLEYSGKWLNTDVETLFFNGKPSKSTITDCICKMYSNNGDVIIDAEFEVCEVTLQDYAMFV